ncbi:sensor histidine kinase [Kushneria aurantia]|uniref:histidine kinase n=1 Tax=Kushneria aurantia TaxID=504092 RepID=A0ABV6G0R2_9GAMM|nr:HAMP domain-containing sensor histidine kinase [Kushneria aurantia]
MSVRVTSLHSRLLVWLLVLLGAIWIATWANNQGRIDERARQEVDNRLLATATLVLKIQRQRGAEALPDGALAGAGAPSDALPAFELRSRSRVVLRSADFPTAETPATPGFSNQAIDGRRWRLYTAIDESSGLTVRVALGLEQQQASVEALHRDFDSPLLWLLPALALASLASVWLGLGPLRRLERQVASIDPTDPRPLALPERRVPRELRSLVHQLDQRLDEVRDVYARQRAFTASAAHELRTPLAGCLAQLRPAQHGRDDEARRRAFGRIRQGLDHMTELIRRMLLLARLDRAGNGIDKQTVALDEIAREVIETYRERAVERGIALELALPSRPLLLIGEPSLLSAMLANPLENALNASPTDSRVNLALGVEEGEVFIRTRDDGCGIPHEERARIFDPFHQGHDDTYQGSGLGLTIVQAIVHAHHGRIAVRDAEHGGTMIEIHLPLNENRPEA